MAIYENIPTTKLLSSLRHSGYSSVSAIADLVDNSIDAGATKVDILIESDGAKICPNTRVSVIDNGCGMHRELLVEALKVGSETSHKKGDLGKFGMGLITSPLSFGREIDVLTRVKGGEHLHGLFDHDFMIENKTWEITVDEMDSKQVKQFRNEVGAEGTIVTVGRIDRCTYALISAFVSNLKNHIGRVYFERLGRNLNITVNGEEVLAKDPLEPSVECPIREDEIVCEELGVNMSVVLVPKTIPDDKEWNIAPSGAECGVWYVRSGRLISHKSFKSLGRAPHNSLNRLRVVVRFNEDADEPMGVPYSKDNVEPSQGLLDKMKRIAGPLFKEATRRYNQGVHTSSSSSTEDEIDKAKKRIKSTSGLHLFPNKDKQKREKSGKTTTKGTQKPRKSQRHHAAGRTFEVKFVSNSPMDQLMVFDVENGEIVLTWNINHPFYQKFMVDGVEFDVECEHCGGINSVRQEHSVMEVFQYVAFSLASSMLVGVTEEVCSLDETDFEMVSHYLVGKMSDTLRYVSMKDS